MQACSDLAHVVLVLVHRVTVVIVHIGLEEVVVVFHFCVAIFVRELLYQEIFSLQCVGKRVWWGGVGKVCFVWEGGREGGEGGEGGSVRVWCGVVWCGVVWCGAGAVRCGAVWCGVVRCWCGADRVHCACVCPLRASGMQLITMDWRHCTSPFGWTDQPETP